MSGEAAPLTDDEIELQRQLTPGTQNVNHLNHAGSSLPPTPVHDRVLRHLTSERDIGGYEAAAQVVGDDDAVYGSIAALINAEPAEVARTEHATAAWNAGFWSIPMKQGQRILTAEAAYGANAIAFLRAEQQCGVTIEVVPSDSSGQVDVTELERRLGGDVALVAVTHVPTNGGLINPAADIGKLTNAHGVPFLLDACQSIGQIDLDVKALGCDLLSATGRKYLRGPRGSGFLYASNSIIESLQPTQPDHHGAIWSSPHSFEYVVGARRFEYWEYNHAAWLGLGAAVDHARSIGLDRIEATIRERSEQLRALVRNVGLPVFDLGNNRSGIVTTALDGVDPQYVKEMLATKHINMSTSSPASTLWDATRRELPTLLRFSVHYTTTVGEISQAMDELDRIQQGA